MKVNKYNYQHKLLLLKNNYNLISTINSSELSCFSNLTASFFKHRQ